jgi:Flp pilus assembly protein TadB
VPLSEDEQRILRQIEEQLQRDPGFRGTAPRQDGQRRRHVVLSVAATVFLLLLSVLLLAVSPYLSFVVFAGAVAVGVWAERSVRMLTDQALATLADSMRVRAPGRRGPAGN